MSGGFMRPEAAAIPMSIPQSGGGPIERPEQLAEYLEAGCKPKEDWRIGTEHEKFGYCKDTLKPLPYEGERSIRAMLEGLRDRFGWAPGGEAATSSGWRRTAPMSALEPGGQLELSGAPLETIHETCDEVNEHLREVQEVADEIGVGFIGLGAAPIWTHDEMPMMPKGRYKLMTDYMDRVGTMGKTDDVPDLHGAGEPRLRVRGRHGARSCAWRWRCSRWRPRSFANSPFFEGKPNGHKSWRSRVWRDLDPARTGMLPFVFEDGFGFERYGSTTRSMCRCISSTATAYIDALGQSFRDFLKGELPALPGETPTLSDWADHLTTIFPEARIKKFIEMRGADGGPWRRLCALPAFWVGLMYDQGALDAAWDLVKGWDAETREALRVAASVDGLQARGRGHRHARSGARGAGDRRGRAEGARAPGAGGLIPDETHFLNALKESVETGRCPPTSCWSTTTATGTAT
jgi:glutamate--cysteine ligase